MEKNRELKAINWESLPNGISVIIEFLSAKKDFTAPLNEVAQELVVRDVVGFGVEPSEIIFEAERDKIIFFDPKTQEVKLIRKEK